MLNPVAVHKVDDGPVNLEGHALAKTTSSKHDSSISSDVWKEGAQGMGVVPSALCPHTDRFQRRSLMAA